MKASEIVDAFKNGSWAAKSDESYVVAIYTGKPAFLFVTNDEGAEEAVEATSFDVIGPIPAGEIDDTTLKIANYLDANAPEWLKYSLHTIQGTPMSQLSIQNFGEWVAEIMKRSRSHPQCEFCDCADPTAMVGLSAECDCSCH